MGDNIGIPAFGEHGNGHHTAEGISQFARFTHGVHNFPQEILVSEFFPSGGSLADLHLPLELLDFLGGHRPKVGIEGITRFQLLAVNQEGTGTG